MIYRPRVELARAKAQEVLTSLGITDPPVNGEGLVRSWARVRLLGEEDDSEEDAVTAWNPYYGYIVIVRETILDGRRNWNFAHEGGHIRLGHLEQFNPDELSDRELNILDREADIFAREVLMPAEWVVKWVPMPCGLQMLGAMKELFGVSWEALAWRLHELGRQPYDVTKQILRERRASVTMEEAWEMFIQSLAGA